MDGIHCRTKPPSTRKNVRPSSTSSQIN
jgi:hypothetical protein